jgi:hypothetical protein
VSDGVVSCFRFYGDSTSLDTEAALARIESLLKANPAVIDYVYDDGGNILHWACASLKNEVGTAVLKFLFSKYNDRSEVCLMSANDDGDLPIYYAAQSSTVNVIELLLEKYPESVDEKGNQVENLLHKALLDNSHDRNSFNAKVRYLCDRKPGFLLLNDDLGYNPVNRYLYGTSYLDLETILIMCDVDKTIVRQECLSDDGNSGMLPLHFFFNCHYFTSTVDFAGDCCRYLFKLYPEAAGIKDDEDRSPYDLFCMTYLATDTNIYFERLLLNADLTIDPERRRDLNYAARREVMFLAFSALSSDQQPSILIKLRYESRDLLAHAISYL